MRLIIADDQVVIRRFIKAILAGSGDFKLVGEAEDGCELLELFNNTNAEMVIADLSMPRLGGLEAIRQIKRQNANTKVLALTMHKEKQYVVKALAAGANGFILKDYLSEELLPALAIIREGGLFISKIIFLQEDSLDPKDYNEQASQLLGTLTPREVEILRLVCMGKSSRDIAEMLHISVVTVKNHRSHIKKKLKAGSNAELINFALQIKFFTIDPLEG